jgi:ribonuclease HI
MGGWAFVVLKGEEKVKSAFFPVPNTTNNRMEVQAAIEACDWAKAAGISEFTLFTDSMYVIGTMTLDWKRKKNTDLWELMDESSKDLKIHWKHIKGHTGNKYNELCDALAVQATFITE